MVPTFEPRDATFDQWRPRLSTTEVDAGESIGVRF